MSAEQPSEEQPHLPLVSFAGLTEGYDLQTSIVDELLGGPLVLKPVAPGALASQAVDPALTIHPHRGCERAQLGWTRQQLVASLGEPDSVHSAVIDDLDLGTDLNYTRLGLVAELRQGVVIKLTFHSGTKRGGLLPLRFEPWAGRIAPDLDLTSTREATLRARFGPPERVQEPDVDLAELMDERPTRDLDYPGWGFRVYDDGTLESVAVPRCWVPL